MNIILALIIYLSIGIGRVIKHSKQPLHNQPHYIRHPKISLTLLYIATWPLLFIDDIYCFYMRHKMKKQ